MDLAGRPRGLTDLPLAGAFLTVQTPAWIVLVTAIPAMVFTVGALWYLVIAPSSRGYLRRYRR